MPRYNYKSTYQRISIKTLLFIFFYISLFAQSYPFFTQKELNNIEKHNGKISKNRVMDYQKNMYLIKTYPKAKQLIRVNFYLNQLLPQYDDVIQKKEDYWATPKEFLITGYGDCEDYAIIKYYSLIKLGFDEKKLFITTVREKYSGGYHMVLSYFKNKNQSPLILDNLSFKVLNLKTRKDLKADLFINSTGVYKLSEKNILIKVADYATQYKELVEKIQKEN